MSPIRAGGGGGGGRSLVLEYDFYTFAKFLRALCGQMSQSVDWG